MDDLCPTCGGRLDGGQPGQCICLAAFDEAAPVSIKIGGAESTRADEVREASAEIRAIAFNAGIAGPNLPQFVKDIEPILFRLRDLGYYEGSNVQMDQLQPKIQKLRSHIVFLVEVIEEGEPSCDDLSELEQPIEWGHHLTDLQHNPKLQQYLSRNNLSLLNVGGEA